MITWPCGVLCRLEAKAGPAHEHVFSFWAQVFALFPGVPGMYLRRAFYQHALDHCHHDAHIGFGAIFTHRRARVEAKVYVGCYALIGCAVLRESCMIGSRASLLSGGNQHELDEEGNWTPVDLTRLVQIEIGENAWLGEGAIVMANVGPRAMVSAGAVVSNPVPAEIMVGGNPARFIRRLVAPERPKSEFAASENLAPAKNTKLPATT